MNINEITEGAMHIHSPAPVGTRVGRIKDLFPSVRGNRKFKTVCCRQRKQAKDLIVKQEFYEWYESTHYFFCTTSCKGDAE